ncbi:NADP-dependent oxidoreductase [Pannonibacter phragmitetus]|jgi:NADPH:quinone reductase-like Zn-dependent oxidoreductase|uniref:NADP-dependent oxidoreductase n=1 Tax=Pannonibacter phragmitetus TaxID=121719 RepID=UPI000F01A3F6|nr:NADP-dependent oxidoreductase [Pannonibacter phragmitetus]
MTQARVALFSDYGDIDKLYINTLELPEPGPGQVRVRVAGAAVNPVDVKTRKGYLKDWFTPTFPAQLGNDLSGTVEAVGEGVASLKVGDKVVGNVDAAQGGAYADRVNAYEAALVKVPDGIDLIDASAVPTGALTGVQLIERAIGAKPGDRILVTGAGGSTGRAAVFAALDAGAVVFGGVRTSSLDAVADLPVAGVVNLEDGSGLEKIGVLDAVADTVGGAVAEDLSRYVKPDGTVASIGFPAPVAPEGSSQRFVHHIVEFDGERLSRFLADLVRLNRTMPVAKRLPLEQVGEAHRLLEAGGVGGKIVLVP